MPRSTGPTDCAALAEHLHPGGVFALWSNGPPVSRVHRRRQRGLRLLPRARTSSASRTSTRRPQHRVCRQGVCLVRSCARRKRIQRWRGRPPEWLSSANRRVPAPPDAATMRRTESVASTFPRHDLESARCLAPNDARTLPRSRTRPPIEPDAAAGAGHFRREQRPGLPPRHSARPARRSETCCSVA